MIRIVTDTASDLSLKQAEALNVDIVSMNIQFGNTHYDQLSDENFLLFYELLETEKEFPKTSQPSPDEYLQIFEKAKQAGDSVLVITISGGLSGSVQAAHIAKDIADYDDIYIIDSKQATMGQRLLVEYAARLRDEGKGITEIYAIISEAAGRVKLFAALDTLKYLWKGGRIPKSTEVVGTLLGIKPIISLDASGSVIMAGKARGRAGAVTSLVKLIDENLHFDEAAPVYFGYTGDKAPVAPFKKLATNRYKLTNTVECAVGGTVGAHIGRGAFAIVYLAANKGDKK